MDIEEINIRCLTFFSFEYLQILNVPKVFDKKPSSILSFKFAAECIIISGSKSILLNDS